METILMENSMLLDLFEGTLTDESKVLNCTITPAQLRRDRS